jgi:hypothetical protein
MHERKKEEKKASEKHHTSSASYLGTLGVSASHGGKVTVSGEA